MTIHTLDYIDIFMMSASTIIIFLHKYNKCKDSIVGWILMAGWIFQIMQTLSGARVSSLSDVLFDGISMVIIASCGGNIMSILVFDGIKKKWHKAMCLIGVEKHENK